MSDKGRTFFRMIKIALLVFLLVLGGIGIVAWMTGDSEEIPLEYEGYD